MRAGAAPSQATVSAEAFGDQLVDTTVTGEGSCRIACRSISYQEVPRCSPPVGAGPDLSTLTHFVSRVRLGDTIMQVFACQTDRFNRMRAA